MQAFVSGNLPAVLSCIVVGGNNFVLEDIVLQEVGFLGRVEDLLLESFR